MSRNSVLNLGEALAKTMLVMSTIGMGLLMGYVVAHDGLNTNVTLVQKASPQL